MIVLIFWHILIYSSYIINHSDILSWPTSRNPHSYSRRSFHPQYCTASSWIGVTHASPVLTFSTPHYSFQFKVIQDRWPQGQSDKTSLSLFTLFELEQAHKGETNSVIEFFPPSSFTYLQLSQESNISFTDILRPALMSFHNFILFLKLFIKKWFLFNTFVNGPVMCSTI